MDVIEEMKRYFGKDQKLVDHTLEVLEYAQKIMDKEHLDEKTKKIVTDAAVLHDIGVIEARRKYGSSADLFQEREGQIIARSILEKIGRSSEEIDRVCFIVGHHHTPSAIDGIDFQIVWEADQIVNVKSKGLREEKENLDKYFKTSYGKQMLKEMIDKSI
ncbi:MAG: HD domain-containing protein [Thermotogae bacterium]|nr:HD domain-containing protein [Thermotogota bacterium]